MPNTDSSAQIVARFLRANHYTSTLEAFIQEAGLPEDAGSITPGAWTIEQILQEKIEFDTSINFEKRGGNEKKGWTTPAPCTFAEPQLEITSNVLCVGGALESNTISVTTADRKWRRFLANSPYSADPDAAQSGDSPVLSTVFVPGGFVLSTAMSGHLSLSEAGGFSLIDRCRHHAKYAVQVVSHRDDQNWFVATAGWDQKIYVYSLDFSSINSARNAPGTGIVSEGHLLGDPVHVISLRSNPESLLFVQHPDSKVIYLVASRRDSTHLYFYQLERQSSGEVTVYEAGTQNLAPHSNAWVAFTPCSLTACPTDPTLVAVATSHLPHLKLIICRLLLPIQRENQSMRPTEHQTQASMARAELALQDREDAAINLHVSTMAPQTPYSTPQVVWRPDGSGVYVNGDDGVIRGIETTTGKIVSLLKGHEIGSKVRTLWAGSFGRRDDGSMYEVLVSGGFDKKVLVWTTASET